MDRCLIIDADDTLWENNIYFERAIDEFIVLMQPALEDPAPISADIPARIHETLRQVEMEMIPVGGYGTRNFVYALKETCCRLYKGSEQARFLGGIEQIGERLIRHPVDLRPGVLEALPQLNQRYRLMMFSKGDLQEQTGKLERSGLRRYFDRVIIVPEKDTSAYESLLRGHELHPDRTFMIGNSPRSDVLPALAAGLWAVFLPHPNTWEHEESPVVPHPRLLRAESFGHLPDLLTEHHSRQTA